MQRTRHGGHILSKKARKDNIGAATFGYFCSQKSNMNNSKMPYFVRYALSKHDSLKLLSSLETRSPNAIPKIVIAPKEALFLRISDLRCI